MKFLVIPCLLGAVLSGAVVAVQAYAKPHGPAGQEADVNRGVRDRAAATPAIPHRALPGCDATITVDLKNISRVPGVQNQLDWIWNRALEQISAKRNGREFIKDLVKEGLTSWDQIDLVTACVPPAAGLSRDPDALERAGVMISANLAPGALERLLLKWANARDMRLREYRGFEILDLDNLRVAQRHDGAVVIANDDSSLRALLTSPPLSQSHDSAVTFAVNDLAASSANKIRTSPLPLSRLHRCDLVVSQRFDRVDVAVDADDPATAAEVATLINLHIAELSGDLANQPGQSITSALAAALWSGRAKHTGTSVTLSQTIPEQWLAQTLSGFVRSL